jgi:hypothetical protein
VTDGWPGGDLATEANDCFSVRYEFNHLYLNVQ